MSNRELSASMAPGAMDSGSDDPPVSLDPKARVVLVTNDDAITTELEGPLRNAGHQVTIVREGRSALQEVRAQGADLVMLDLVLPDIDGIALLR